MTRSLSGLLLGAGFSYEAGMPLVWEVTSEFRRELMPEVFRALNGLRATHGNGWSTNVVDDVCLVLQRPEMHYESILGYIEAQYRRGHPSHIQQEYHGAYSWLVEGIYHLLHLRHVHNAAKIAHWIRLLDGVSHLASKNAPLWVFSLNHDLLVEALAARHSIPLNCGFPDGPIRLPRRDKRGIKIGELVADTISQASLEAGQRGFFREGETGINLLKIHGSLDVFASQEGKELIRLLPNDSTPLGVFESLRLVNTELRYVEPAHPNGQIGVTNEIVFADDNGEMRFLRRTLLSGAYKFDQHRDQVLPKRVLEDFRLNLNKLSNLICIGYSFGDLHINKVVREWLEWGADRTVQIVDPGIQSVPGVLLHLSPQVELRSEKAVDYLDGLAGITRTRFDSVQRRILEWSRKRESRRMGLRKTR
jgi:hypothetical protein